MLRVKLLTVDAKPPVVAHVGEDLAYDIYTVEAAVLPPVMTSPNPLATTRVRTGIAVEARHPQTGAPLGLLVRDRSSMASKGVIVTGGVIDAGYRGEILVMLTNLSNEPIQLKAGEKIAQMIPVPVLTGAVEVVDSLEESSRADKGFGSSGR
jgi:dUTP pyrophosphatase